VITNVISADGFNRSAVRRLRRAHDAWSPLWLTNSNKADFAGKPLKAAEAAGDFAIITV
jgi:hypothetical protein